MHAESFPISSNGYSVDMQAVDAMSWLEREAPESYALVLAHFPEFTRYTMSGGSWFDTEVMCVDVEWGSWLADAIESTGLVSWVDGEPYAIGLDFDTFAEG